jgi:hypothetical protein
MYAINTLSKLNNLLNMKKNNNFDEPNIYNNNDFICIHKKKKYLQECTCQEKWRQKQIDVHYRQGRPIYGNYKNNKFIFNETDFRYHNTTENDNKKLNIFLPK